MHQRALCVVKYVADEDVRPFLASFSSSYYFRSVLISSICISSSIKALKATSPDIIAKLFNTMSICKKETPTFIESVRLLNCFLLHYICLVYQIKLSSILSYAHILSR